MGSSSLSLILLNLFVGLCKGSRHLRPYSASFRRLGFEVHGIEFRFRLEAGGVSHPDMILCSETVRSTILLEWTESREPANKEEQLRRYASITKTDVTVTAGVPVDASDTYDVSVAVPRAHALAFASFLEEKGHEFPLLACDYRSGVALARHGHPFSNAHVDEFFREGVELDRLPMGYIPFAPDEFSETDLAQPVAGEAFARFIGQSSDFTAPEFCSTCFSDIWPVLGNEARSRLETMTRRVLMTLTRFPVGNARLVARVRKSPSVWKVADVTRYKPQQVQSMRRGLKSFINYVERNPNRQGELFD